jgi:hypothetical protein
MFTKKPSTEDIQLRATIDKLLAELHLMPSHTDEYAAIADQLVKLYPLLNASERSKVSPDVLATIAANIAGILIIVGHERANVIGSKALNLLLKLR